MDALAAYGSDSDDSGSESDHVSSTVVIKQTTSTSQQETYGGSTSSKVGSLSSMLPPPKSGGGSGGGSSSAGPAKTSKYSTMPTLEDGSDSEEEESEFRKKARLAAAAKSAGGVDALFAMLPAPKNAPTTSAGSSSGKPAAAKSGFMPRTVKKATPAVVKKPAPTVTDEKDGEHSDDDDDDEGPVSFFPLGAAATGSTSGASKPASNSYIPLFFDNKPLTTEEQQAQNATYVDVSATNEQYAYPSNDQYAYPSNDQYAYPTNDQYAYPTNDQHAYPTNEAYSAGQYAESSTASTGGRAHNMIELDDVGLQKLGMRKARDVPINVIDINANDQMGQAQHVRQAMASSGQSQPKPVDLASIEHLKPTAGQKRKHNIMSLAYQAKANQHQLSASWASSRQTKAETQSKYGF